MIRFLSDMHNVSGADATMLALAEAFLLGLALAFLADMRDRWFPPGRPVNS